MTTTFSRESLTDSSTKVVNAGVIGFGFIGEVHVRAIRAANGIVHSIAAKTLEEAKEALALEVVDLSTWQIKDAESQYNNVEEVQ